MNKKIVFLVIILCLTALSFGGIKFFKKKIELQIQNSITENAQKIDPNISAQFKNIKIQGLFKSNKTYIVNDLTFTSPGKYEVLVPKLNFQPQKKTSKISINDLKVSSLSGENLGYKFYFKDAVNITLTKNEALENYTIQFPKNYRFISGTGTATISYPKENKPVKVSFNKQTNRVDLIDFQNSQIDIHQGIEISPTTLISTSLNNKLLYKKETKEKNDIYSIVFNTKNKILPSPNSNHIKFIINDVDVDLLFENNNLDYVKKLAFNKFLISSQKFNLAITGTAHQDTSGIFPYGEGSLKLNNFEKFANFLSKYLTEENTTLIETGITDEESIKHYQNITISMMKEINSPKSKNFKALIKRSPKQKLTINSRTLEDLNKIYEEISTELGD
jgi:hypothetical protein